MIHQSAWMICNSRQPRHARAPALASTSQLFPIAHGLSLSSPLGKGEGGKAVLLFVRESKACFKPREQLFDPDNNPEFLITPPSCASVPNVLSTSNCTTHGLLDLLVEY